MSKQMKLQFFLNVNGSDSNLSYRVKLFHNFGHAIVKHLFPYFERSIDIRILSFLQLFANRCRILVANPSKMQPVNQYKFVCGN